MACGEELGLEQELVLVLEPVVSGMMASCAVMDH